MDGLKPGKMDGIKKDLKSMYQPFLDVFADGPMKVMPNVLKCTNFLEFCGCMTIALVAHNSAGNTFNFAVIFSVLYVVYGSQLGVRLRANPALSMVDFMRGDNGEGCDVFKQIVFQTFGYAAGFALGGAIGLDAHEAHGNESDFATLLFDGVMSSAVLCWLWMHVHDKDVNGGWSDFMGLAAGLAIWLAAQMAVGSAHMNSAVLSGEDFGRSVGFWREDGWGLNEWAQFFAPILSAFLTSLVYAFFRK